MISKEEVKKRQREQLNSLIAWVGSKARLARELGVTRQVVSGWCLRGRISATCATLVERKTAGLFKRENMRPDVKEWEDNV